MVLEGTKNDHQYFIVNKPYNMVSQFVSPHNVGLLGDLNFKFPEGTHAIGRLDNHSEGLLILTTNKKVTRLLYTGDVPHQRVYLVQINNELSKENLEKLQNGVSILIEGGKEYTTPPCDVRVIADPRTIYRFVNSFNQFGVHTWILISLFEGKYRQVRKMVKAVNHRCKRLIRVSIEDLLLEDLQPGEVNEIKESDFFKKLKIGNY